MSFGEYNGDAVYDMWVDYTYQEYTGSGGGSCGNHGGRYYHFQPRKQSIKEQIAVCRNRIKLRLVQLERLEARLEEAKRKLENPNLSPHRLASLNNVVTKNFPNQIACIQEKIKKDEDKITSLLMEHEKRTNALTVVLCIAAIFLAVFIFLMIFK